MSATERKQAILEAAAPVFARLGRAGTTTKDIAKAAGVSEALLYRHFSGKEALYEELEAHCVQAQAVGRQLLDSAPPCTATLVTGVAILVHAVSVGIGPRQPHDDTKRLVTASLLGDGRFAKTFLDRHVKPWVGVFEKSLEAARVAGDLEDGVDTGKAEIWFVHHLANTLHLISLSGHHAVDYGMSQAELTNTAIRFLLRGLGVKSAAVNKHFDPTELARILARMNPESP